MIPPACWFHTLTLTLDVNCSGAGLVHDPSHPSNHKTM